MWNSESIKELRKALDLSQSAFSKKLGIRQQTVSEWETGVYMPRGGSLTLLDLICNELKSNSNLNTSKKIEAFPLKEKAMERSNKKRDNPIYYVNVSSSNNGHLLPI